MPETLKDIERKAAGEVSSLFGEKSARKIAILAETSYDLWPTEALENKFLPALRQIFQMLGLKRGALPLGTREFWLHQEGPSPLSSARRREYRPLNYLGAMLGGATIEKYAEQSTSFLLKGVLGKKESKSVDPAVKEKIKQFYRLVGTDLKKQPVERDPTFVDEAEWFKRYMGGKKMLYKHPTTGKVTEVQLENPWAEVDVYPYYGEEELRKRGQEIAEEYEGETVSLGIFGHAGSKFGGVGVGEPAWREAFQDVDIDTAFIAACSMTQRPEICEVMSANLSKEEKKVVIIATDKPWGTSMGYNPEVPSVKVVFQKEADIGVFKASPELIERVQTGEWKPEQIQLAQSTDPLQSTRQPIDTFMDWAIPQRQEETNPCAGMTGNDLSDCEAGLMLYNLFQGVSGLFRQQAGVQRPPFGMSGRGGQLF
jgi:hypothetical protein